MSSLLSPSGRLPTLTPSQLEALSHDIPLRLPPHIPRPLGSPPPRRSRRTRADRARERPPLSSRRQRRVCNELLLRELEMEHCATPNDFVEMKRLLMRTSRSAWQVLEQDRDAMHVWKAFVDLGEDGQRRVLEEKEERKEQGTALGAGNLWGVDGRVKGLWKTQPDFVRKVVEEVEREIGGLEEEGGERRLRLPHAMARLVGHTVAQWHRVRHWSEGFGDERVMVIEKDERKRKREGRLLDVLGETA